MQNFFVLCLLFLGLLFSLATGDEPDPDAGFNAGSRELDCRAYQLDGGGYSEDAPEECLQDDSDGYLANPNVCTPLVQSYCGSANECYASPSCIAVRWMEQEQDLAQCESLATDSGEFVVCIDVHLCEALVQKTCGAPPAALSEDSVCVQRPACQQALASYQRLHDADGGGYSIAEFCGQALQEPSAFPACNEE